MSLRRLQLDGSVRSSADGRRLSGGSPFRLLRLTGPQAERLRALLAGADPATAEDRSLRRRLLRAGFLRPPTGPCPTTEPSTDLGQVDVVIPTRDRPTALAALLDELTSVGAASITVVDDGSWPPVKLDDRHRDVHVIRHPVSQGPGAARNAGAANGQRRYLLFIDDDITLAPGNDPSATARTAIDELLAPLTVDDIGAVGPRIVTRPDDSWLGRFEQAVAPLDRGPEAAIVVAGARVSFLPTGVLAVRRTAFADVGGFRAAMAQGEDVDLVWRFDAAGWLCCYRPEVAVEHPPWPDGRTWLAQRRAHGRGEAELAVHHPDTVAALTISPWSLVVWVLLALGGRVKSLTALVIWAASIGLLAPKLADRSEHPSKEAVTLAGLGTLHSGEAVARAVVTGWWPAVAAVSPWSRRARRVGLASALIPALLAWRRERPPLDPVRWTVARTTDDLAHGAGLWAAMAATRSLRAARISWQSLDDLVLPEGALPPSGDVGDSEADG